MGGNYAVERIARDYPYLTPAIIRARLRASSYVNIERGYLYYSMPKAACTSLKWLIHSLEDLPPIGPVVDGVRGVTRDMVIHARKQFKLPSLPDLDNATQERVLESPDFLRFTVVRNPYSRLVSAWFEKVSLCQPGYEFVYWRILGHSPDGTRQITLPEFIRYISKHDLTRCDHHWRLQVEHGFFRTINFNLVGRVEQLGDATAEFARRAGFPPDTRVRAQNVSNSGRVALTEDLADQIFDLYQRDFVELSYPKDAWQKKPRASSADREPSRDENILEEIRERNIVAGHLYAEIDRLRSRIRALESGPAPSLEPYREETFDSLFDDHISKIEGWLGREAARQLYVAARNATSGCIVEVGSYRGRSTAALALGTIAGASLPVYAIDPHETFTGWFGGEFGPEDRGHFMRTMLRLGLYRQVRLINLGSTGLRGTWPHPISLLWIDGDQRYEAVARDFNIWAERLAPGALVIFDEGKARSGGPRQVVSELVADGRFILEGRAGKIASLRFHSAPAEQPVRIAQFAE